MSGLLEVTGVSKSFGGVRAVHGMDLEVAGGLIYGIIGPNGSGKTTFLGLLSGTYRPDSGVIRLHGRRLGRLSAHRTVGVGIARTFQTTRLFSDWSLQENMQVAWEERSRRRDRSRARRPDLGPGGILELVGLSGRAATRCASLSNAEQRLAMVAVAVATEPDLLLLDEPAVGMSPPEADSLASIVRRLRDELELTVLIVEHNMHFMMPLADRILAMNAGTKLAEGTPAEVRRDPAVIASYLGT